MKFKFVAIVMGLMALAIGIAACSDTGTANNSRNTNMANLNKNTAVVVNATPANTNSNRWNSNISKEEYEKDKAGYEKGKTTTEVIGDGINDSWLWFKTRSALAMAEDLRDSTISVSVSNEVVTLAGTVASAAQKASAEKVAKGITGIKSVKNELKVSANDSVTNQMVNGNTSPRNANATKKEK
jgi:hyperosmotically inducible protein